jgi:hypothetical protein
MMRELIAAAILASIAAGYYALAVSIESSALADEIGPTGLPIVYAIALGTLAIALAGHALVVGFLRGAAHSAPAGNAGADRQTLVRATGMLAIGAVYLACVSWLGYIVSLAAVILAVALYQGEPFGRRIVATAAGGALSFWVFFVLLLGVEMPTGFWPIIWGGEWIR